MGVKGKKNVVEYTYDFAVDGGTNGTNIDLSAKDGAAVLPVGALVTDVVAYVETACTSDGAATVSWGTETDEDGFSGTTIAVASLTANSVWSAGVQGSEALIWDNTNDHRIVYRVADANGGEVNLLISTADLTAGKIRLMVEYYMPGAEA